MKIKECKNIKKYVYLIFSLLRIFSISSIIILVSYFWNFFRLIYITKTSSFINENIKPIKIILLLNKKNL